MYHIPFILSWCTYPHDARRSSLCPTNSWRHDSGYLIFARLEISLVFALPPSSLSNSRIFFGSRSIPRPRKRDRTLHVCTHFSFPDLLFLLNVWSWIENHPNRTYFPIIDMKPKTHKGCYWRLANFNLLENTDIVAIHEYLLDVEFGFPHSSHLAFKIFHVWF